MIEFAGISQPTFYEHSIDREQCFAVAFEDGVERLSDAIEATASGERGWVAQLSAGLDAGLGFLADDPALADLLLIESLAAARPARVEHERMLSRLAQLLRPPSSELPGGEIVSEEVARLLAGGLVSHVSGRVLAGEAARLPESRDLLLEYLLTPSLASPSRPFCERRAERG